MRPGQPPAQRHRHRTPAGHLVEARAQFAAGVGGVARCIGQPEAAAVLVDLAVGRRVEALRLQGGVRRHADRGGERSAVSEIRDEKKHKAIKPASEGELDSYLEACRISIQTPASISKLTNYSSKP